MQVGCRIPMVRTSTNRGRELAKQYPDDLAALRFVIARGPDHPGANHFYMRTVETVKLDLAWY